MGINLRVQTTGGTRQVDLLKPCVPLQTAELLKVPCQTPGCAAPPLGALAVTHQG